MKKRIVCCFMLFLVIGGVFSVPDACFGGERAGCSGAAGMTAAPGPAGQILSAAQGQVASEEEMAAPQQVGEEGMIAVSGADVKDGVYDITVDSSSSMFNITAAKLTVKDGRMSAVMTMSGKGYLMVFMGTGEEAAAADEAQYIPFTEDKNGAHTFEVPVEALNQAVPLSSFSKAKEKWYDRQLVFRADSLPEDAVSVDLDAGKLQYRDGTYTIAVSLAGGTGRASVSSPALLTITDGEAVARIEWSSANYDYMVAGGKKYFPIAGEGHSVFEIPVYVFDQPVTVIADTTAMSQPHEIEYVLTFHADTIEKEGGWWLLPVAVAAGLAIILVAIVFVRKKKKNYEKNMQ